MSQSLVVELADFTHADIPAVRAIDEQVYADTWSESLLADDIVRDNRHHLVARIGGVVVGHGSLMTMVDEGHITTVAVDPQHQRKGIARRIVLALCEAAVAQGLALLTLEVRASNRGAQRLYSGFGFAPVGVRKGYYKPEGEDALLLTAHDISSANFRDRLDRIQLLLTETNKDSSHG